MKSKTLNEIPITDNIERNNLELTIKKLVEKCLDMQENTDLSLIENTRDYLNQIVLHDYELPILENFPNEELLLKSLTEINKIYWKELDGINNWVRHRIKKLVRERIILLGQHIENDVIASMMLRQLIEITFWAVYYQWVQTSAANAMITNLKLPFGGLITSTDLEFFIRGALAPSEDRIKSGLAAAAPGLENEFTNPSTNYAVEIDATISKQRAVLLMLVKERDKFDSSAMEKDVQCLENSYTYLCGLVHVTPLLIGANTKEVYDHSFLWGPLVINTLLSSLTLLDTLYFDQRFLEFNYLQLFHARITNPKEGSADCRIPWIADVTNGNKPISFDLTDGTTLNIYGNKKKK